MKFCPYSYKIAIVPVADGGGILQGVSLGGAPAAVMQQQATLGPCIGDKCAKWSVEHENCLDVVVARTALGLDIPKMDMGEGGTTHDA